ELADLLHPALAADPGVPAAHAPVGAVGRHYGVPSRIGPGPGVERAAVNGFLPADVLPQRAQLQVVDVELAVERALVPVIRPARYALGVARAPVRPVTPPRVGEESLVLIRI